MYVEGQDTDFPPSSKELSKHVAQLESIVAKRSNKITELGSTVKELARAVVQKERESCAMSK